MLVRPFIPMNSKKRKVRRRADIDTFRTSCFPKGVQKLSVFPNSDQVAATSARLEWVIIVDEPWKVGKEVAGGIELDSGAAVRPSVRRLSSRI